MTLKHIFLLTAAALMTSCAPASDVAPPEGPAVGMKRLTLEDTSRKSWSGETARPVTTLIWYPAPDDVKMTEFAIPPNRPVFTGGYAARDAALASGEEKYPLVLLSHGTGGAAAQMMWLGRELAANGYVVAAVDHHGNSVAEGAFDPRGFRMPWERATDLSFVIDALSEDEFISSAIDFDNISAAGFSLGGYTVTALAGGVFDFAKLEAFCASSERDSICDPNPEFPDAGAEFQRMLDSSPELQKAMMDGEESFSDKRIDRFVAMAPALGQAFSEESLDNITAPFLIIVGENDIATPPKTNAKYIADLIPSSQFKLVQKAPHYVFLNECNKRGKKYVPVCKDSEGVDRGAVHKMAIGAILDHIK